MSKSLEAIEKLKVMFPLFNYRMDGHGYIIVEIMGTFSMWIRDDLPQPSLDSLAEEHKRAIVKKEWEDKFPHLHFHVSRGNSCPSDVWVKRNGRDADGIPYQFYKHEPDYPRKDKETLLRELAVWDKKAEQASQKGWFLCFLCGEPKPYSEYGYYHFCANYCKECLKKHPDVERRARSENYE